MVSFQHIDMIVVPMPKVRSLSETEREIRLYSNRRLYDTVSSRYIKFADLYRLLDEQVQFTVKEALHRRDCTQKVLLELLIRRELNRQAEESELLTPEFLKEFIRLAATDSAGLMREFLDCAVSLLVSRSSSHP